MTTADELIAELESMGVEVCWARRLNHSGIWVSDHDLLVLSETASEQGLAHACLSVLKRRGQRLAAEAAPRRVETQPKPPTLSPEERASEVRAAVEQIKTSVSVAGEDGVLLADLRRDLCLFGEGIVENALRVARSDVSLVESRDRRPDFHGRPHDQVVLRSRAGGAGEGAALDR